jgi:hypothetical protein
MPEVQTKVPTVGSKQEEAKQHLVRKFISRTAHCPKMPVFELHAGGRKFFNFQDLTPAEVNALFMKATGTVHPSAQRHLITQATAALPNNAGDSVIPHNSLMENLSSMSPKTELEAMLSVQLITVHNFAMDFFSRLTEPTGFEEVTDRQLNRITKLLTVFQKGVSALEKLRQREQVIKVQHVHINQGGQAVIGNVHADKQKRK